MPLTLFDIKPLFRWFILCFVIVITPALKACSDGAQEPVIKSDNHFDVRRIAHAGGGYNGLTYTNSIEAMDYNLAQGMRYFEIDFLFTQDGKLVCMHDWKESFVQAFGIKSSGIPTLAEFEALLASANYEACTLSSLAEWMTVNPSAFIVTDSKDRNLEALRVIKDTLPEAEMRVIPQIYDPKNFARAKEMGFSQIIWTLYRYKRSIGKTKAVLRWTETFEGNFAITMPTNLAAGNLPGLLKERNIPSYTHTINDPETAEAILNHYDISEIYTDVLTPGHP